MVFPPCTRQEPTHRDKLEELGIAPRNLYYGREFSDIVEKYFSAENIAKLDREQIPDLMYEILARAHELTGGNKSAMGEMLGIHRFSLLERLKQFGLVKHGKPRRNSGKIQASSRRRIR